MLRAFLLVSGLLVSGLSAAHADPADFHSGKVIKDYGKTAAIPDARLTKDTQFKIAYDISKAGPNGAVSRYLVTPARFLNMHAEAGVPVENMKIAIVVHGSAHRDLLTNEAYGGENANAGLIAALIEFGATIELCGQTAAHYSLKQEDLLPGVTIGLSAMTAHALLQQEGYTLNPF